MTDLDRIIKTGDRADLKVWLTTCSDKDLIENWVRLAISRVQDFGELCQREMERRGMRR